MVNVYPQTIQSKMGTAVMQKSITRQPPLNNNFAVRNSEPDLLHYANIIAEEYLKQSNPIDRKIKGQYFTPEKISSFMAESLGINKQNFRVLDPGAGIGMLRAAVCNFVLSLDFKTSFSLDAYENDPKIIPFLENVLTKCKSVLEEKGHNFKYKIILNDFIFKIMSL